MRRGVKKEKVLEGFSSFFISTKISPFFGGLISANFWVGVKMKILLWVFFEVMCWGEDEKVGRVFFLRKLER